MKTPSTSITGGQTVCNSSSPADCQRRNAAIRPDGVRGYRCSDVSAVPQVRGPFNSGRFSMIPASAKPTLRNNHGRPIRRQILIFRNSNITMSQKFREALIPKVAERLKALADETRLRLLLRLRRGEANVTELSNELGVAQASISKHLSTLRQVGLIQVRRAGVQAIYSVRDDKVFDMCEIVCDGVVRHLQQEHASVIKPGTPRRLRHKGRK